jgi:hypothetical protein
LSPRHERRVGPFPATHRVSARLTAGDCAAARRTPWGADGVAASDGSRFAVANAASALVRFGADGQAETLVTGGELDSPASLVITMVGSPWWAVSASPCSQTARPRARRRPAPRRGRASFPTARSPEPTTTPSPPAADRRGLPRRTRVCSRPCAACDESARRSAGAPAMEYSAAHAQDPLHRALLG